MTDGNASRLPSPRSITEYIRGKAKGWRASPVSFFREVDHGLAGLESNLSERISAPPSGKSTSRLSKGHLALPAAMLPGSKTTNDLVNKNTKLPKKRKMSNGFNFTTKKNQSPVNRLYSKEELAEYLEVFQLFDTDCSGSIGYNELKDAMTSLGLNSYSHNELEGIIREIDVDGNGEIDFDEFCMVMRKITLKKDTEHETVKLCFDYFDKDGDGLVSEAEFRRVFEDIGGFTSDEIDSIFREADVAGNNRLDYDEFTQMVRNYMSDEGDTD